jgi:glutathione synthase/RimK-type ligase-like ATP-grasp enzyme
LTTKPFLCQFIENAIDLTKKESHDIKYFVTEKLRAFHCDEFQAKKQVLILTRNIDPEADLIGVELFRRGIDYVRLNTEDLPNQLKVRYSAQQNSHLQIEFTLRDEKVKCSNVDVVLLRHFDIKAINFQRDEPTYTFSLQQWEDAYKILQRNLMCEWINNFDFTLHAEDRIEQFSVAKNVGLNIPATIITNDPKEARKFYNSCDGDIVLKPLHHHRIEVNDKVYFIYTHVVADQDLLGFDDLIYAPCILQKRLHKQYELRVTVVGEQVFAAEIDSQSTINGREDMHRCPISNLPKKAVKIENILRECCIKLLKSFGLKYGAIDFVMDKDNILYFLDLNPTGDWYWIEQTTKLPITQAMVDLIERLKCSQD